MDTLDGGGPGAARGISDRWRLIAGRKYMDVDYEKGEGPLNREVYKMQHSGAGSWSPVIGGDLRIRSREVWTAGMPERVRGRVRGLRIFPDEAW